MLYLYVKFYVGIYKSVPNYVLRSTTNVKLLISVEKYTQKTSKFCLNIFQDNLCRYSYHEKKFNSQTLHVICATSFAVRRENTGAPWFRDMVRRFWLFQCITKLTCVYLIYRCMPQVSLYVIESSDKGTLSLENGSNLLESSQVLSLVSDENEIGVSFNWLSKYCVISLHTKRKPKTRFHLADYYFIVQTFSGEIFRTFQRQNDLPFSHTQENSSARIEQCQPFLKSMLGCSTCWHYSLKPVQYVKTLEKCFLSSNRCNIFKPFVRICSTTHRTRRNTIQDISQITLFPGSSTTRNWTLSPVRCTSKSDVGITSPTMAKRKIDANIALGE